MNIFTDIASLLLQTSLLLGFGYSEAKFGGHDGEMSVMYDFGISAKLINRKKEI